ncbi:PRC-barrel domain-containing protein [Leisingera caerulea]|uniref:PRC-barrel domain-containing protein n=1 Tax=Leisingera caerulea TaxID=506591 RepID=UPI0021A7EB7F|nr:PRC-barrel domain-containing protein [Leisingera caerulea]UWQ83451.1 PRC-barrel domain-containing protein [Leisingera caerulea]
MKIEMKSNVRMLVTAAAAALMAGTGYAASSDASAGAEAQIILAANEDESAGASAGADRSRTFGNEGEGTVLDEAGDAETVTETNDSDPAGASAGVDRSRTRDGEEGTEPVAGTNISETAESTNSPSLPNTEGAMDIRAMTVGDLVGKNVLSASNADVGEIDYVIVHDNKLSGVVGVGGFLGMGEHSVAIPLTDFEVTKNGQLRLTAQSEAQLKAMPEIDENAIEPVKSEVILGDYM